MRNRRSHYFGAEERARIEIIPMIDVMMFLLVFFVLIMTEMIQGHGFQVALPEASRPQTVASPGARTLTLAVTAEGPWVLEGEALVAEQAESALRERAQGMNPPPALVIAGDHRVPYERIVRALDAARAAGIESVGLATAEPSAGTP